ncbi:MAG: CPBP family intramembrane metalloprotease, partial [Bacteroidales bacterium]|nr:CPBP family intramembrane metalloprotease [Bacteroidales bacterium]
IVSSVSLFFVFGSMIINHQSFWRNSEINFSLKIIKFATVGFAEEIVFRGWGYNALLKVTTDRKAVIFSTMFFILLHWPAYFIRLYRFGTLDFSGLMTQSISVAICGVAYCWLLKKGKTLWNPIIVHAGYDMLCVLLIG